MHSIAARHPDLHFIVQDHSSVVAAGAKECPVALAPRFEWMSHDFFSPQQPVRGAAAYFLRHILHDWSDEYCIRILSPVVDAMLPGGASRLLVCDVSFFDKKTRDTGLMWAVYTDGCSGDERGKGGGSSRFANDGTCGGNGTHRTSLY
jgi:hypothetical protein